MILVDCSGSMDAPPTKIAAARRATVAAIETMPDRSAFAVVQGTSRATMVYPPELRLAVATPETRAEAAAAVGSLVAAGGTAIGQWLQQARQLLDTHPAGVRHALLLTDGRNEHEKPYELDQVLEQCAGHFSCDARAIGDGWEPGELLRIVDALRGTAEEVRLGDLADDFRLMIARATRRVVPDLRLGVRTMEGVRLRFIRQVHPTAFDLTGDAVEAGERTVELSTGSWGEQTAEYHLGLAVDPGRFDEAVDSQVALVWVRPVGAAGAGPDPEPVGVFAHWTDDLVRATRMDPGLSHYGGQAELRDAVNAGCDAFDAGDLAVALAEWGRAVRLAHGSGNEEILRRLDDVVDVVDPAAGEVRLRDGARPGARKALKLSSTVSAVNPHRPSPLDGAARPDSRSDLECPSCFEISPGGTRFCEACGAPLGSRREPAGAGPRRAAAGTGPGGDRRLPLRGGGAGGEPQLDRTGAAPAAKADRRRDRPGTGHLNVDVPGRAGPRAGDPHRRRAHDRGAVHRAARAAGSRADRDQLPPAEASGHRLPRRPARRPVQ